MADVYDDDPDDFERGLYGPDMVNWQPDPLPPDSDHPFRSLNGATRCVAIVGPLFSGQACGLPPEAHQPPRTTETSPSGGDL